jgi:hypothetical protein
VIHGLLGPHATERQGGAAAPEHGLGRGLGEKRRRATFGVAAADFVVLGRSHRSMGGQGDPSPGDVAPAVAQPWGEQPRQEGMDGACAASEVMERSGQGAQDRGARRSALQRLTGWLDREPGGRGQAHHPHQITALASARHGQGHGVEGLEGARGHSLALQGLRRSRRPSDSPRRVRACAAPSRCRRVSYFLKA